jgi:hypothetical protein
MLLVPIYAIPQFSRETGIPIRCDFVLQSISESGITVVTSFTVTKQKGLENRFSRFRHRDSSSVEAPNMPQRYGGLHKNQFG